VVAKVLESKNQHFGYNALTGKFEDLVKAGVIDPTKVTRTALQNASLDRRSAAHHRSPGCRDSGAEVGSGRRRPRRRHGRHVLRITPATWTRRWGPRSPAVRQTLPSAQEAPTKRPPALAGGLFARTGNETTRRAFRRRRTTPPHRPDPSFRPSQTAALRCQRRNV